MTIESPNPPISDEQAQDLLAQLRRKEGTWIDWGHGCNQLQKAGYLASTIFEETGIEPSQQNLIIVAAQVYDSLVNTGASQELQTYYQGPRADVLYELRILSQKQRLEAAKLGLDKQLDVDGAKDVARAIKVFAGYTLPPEGFTSHPGDAIAYQCWQAARTKKDLQERSRLIAKGLQFAHSPTARTQIEKLLSDFTVVPTAKAPLLPWYRVDKEEQLPRIVAVIGTWPLTREVWDNFTPVVSEEPFGIVNFVHGGVGVPIPGWQVILKAIDPVAILAESDALPSGSSTKREQVIITVDRACTEWDAVSYFLLDREGTLEINWFPEPPTFPILGQVVLILRPKRIFDEANILEPWQMDD